MQPAADPAPATCGRGISPGGADASSDALAARPRNASRLATARDGQPVLPHLSLLLIAVLASCTRTAPPPANAPGATPEAKAPAVTAAQLAGSEWSLLTLDGTPPVDGHGVTLMFEADRLGGYSGCNAFGGRYTFDGDRLRVPSIEQDAAACVLPGAMDQEARLLERLRGGPTVRVSGERLVLAGDAAGQELVFARRHAAAMDPANLIGTRWRLRDTPPAGRPIHIAFESARITGFAGCREFEAEYRARGDTISLPSMRMATTDCPDGEAAIIREGDFTTDLGSASHWAIEGDTLTLTTPGGRVRVFERLGDSEQN